MPSVTTNFEMTLLTAQQVSPSQYTTINSNMKFVVNVLQIMAISRTNTPPGAPSEGDTYLCDTAPTGVWATHDDDIAVYTNGSWKFVLSGEGKHKGLLVYIQDTNEFRYNKNVPPISWVTFSLMSAVRSVNAGVLDNTVSGLDATPNTVVITDPPDYPEITTPDQLRDALVGTTIPEIRDNITTIASKLEAIVTSLVNAGLMEKV